MKTSLFLLSLAASVISFAQAVPRMIYDGDTIQFGTKQFSVWLDLHDASLVSLRKGNIPVLTAAPKDDSRLWLALKQDDTSWTVPADGVWQADTWSQPAQDTICARLRRNHWQVNVFTRLIPGKYQLQRWYEIVWNGPEETKLRGFTAIWGTPVLTPSTSYYLTPGTITPTTWTWDDIQKDGQHGVGNGCSPLIFNLSDASSLLFLSDELAEGAEHGGRHAKHVNGTAVVTDTANICGRMRPGVPQRLGDFWLWIQDNDAETALTRIHEWFRDRGAVPPADRPDWVQRATLYAFHPGGSIGSGWSDWGGFKRSLPQLQRIADLGCNTIWILPIEDVAPYHPRDYYKFAAGLGTAEEYLKLTTTAKSLGMHVWQDCVPHGGSNYFPRAQQHPEWLLQQEDGSTLSYWCFDFRWPSWCDYMKNVAAHYVKTYHLDGFRIDACGGSKIPNWNPDIPYSRASGSLIPGGLAMQSAIRKGVRENNPNGATLAEDGNNYAGTVSDCLYDFTFCYNMMQQFRTLPPADFVRNLRRWLHEQRCINIPGQILMRHVESHDSLRGEYWYGPNGVEAAMAISAWCYGIPMVYMDMEDGHAPVFKKIFALRNSRPEITDGDQDTLSIKAPDGIFAVLRTHVGRAAIGLVNCNPTSVSGVFTLPVDKLPADCRNLTALRNRWNDTTIKLANHGKEISFTLQLPPFGLALLTSDMSTVDTIAPATTMTATTTAQLPVETTEPEKGFKLIRIPLQPNERCDYRIEAANGVWADTFRTRHPHFAGYVRNIYRLPQGGNVLWDSRQWPFGLTPEQARITFQTARGAVTLQFDPQHLPAAVFLLDRVKDDHSPHVFIASTYPDNLITTPTGTAVDIIPATQPVSYNAKLTPSLTAYAGKWLFDNGKIRLWLTRSGSIRSFETYQSDGSLKTIFSDAYLYTDAGYSNDPDYKKLSADMEAEPFSRIDRLSDGSLRLRFTGALRGFYRFAKLKQPIDYVTEYHLKDNADGFAFSFGVRPSAPSSGERVFLALTNTRADNVAKVDMRANGHSILTGAFSKVREAQTQHLQDTAIDEVRLLDADGKLHCRWSNLTYIGEHPENLFVHNRNHFFAFSDHPYTPASYGNWRCVSAYVSTSETSDTVPAPQALHNLNFNQNAVLLDGNFEGADASQWISTIVQNIGTNSPWTLAAGARFVPDCVHSGHTAVCVEGKSGEFRLTRQYLNPMIFKAGTRWRITCWVKGQDIKPDTYSWMTACIRITRFKGNKSDYTTQSFPMGSFDWTQFTFDYTVPEDLTNQAIAIGFNGNTGTLWFDDITITPLP